MGSGLFGLGFWRLLGPCCGLESEVSKICPKRAPLSPSGCSSCVTRYRWRIPCIILPRELCSRGLLSLLRWFPSCSSEAPGRLMTSCWNFSFTVPRARRL
ncbi:hypothetical protein EDB80DRAFT_722630 [Ilyonectria destructans]|nr:hypothetical protein EDB80DRAFT_722630 [Ilyonectria destructans]